MLVPTAAYRRELMEWMFGAYDDWVSVESRCNQAHMLRQVTTKEGFM